MAFEAKDWKLNSWEQEQDRDIHYQQFYLILYQRPPANVIRKDKKISGLEI